MHSLIQKAMKATPRVVALWLCIFSLSSCLKHKQEKFLTPEEMCIQYPEIGKSLVLKTWKWFISICDSDWTIPHWFNWTLIQGPDSMYRLSAAHTSWVDYKKIGGSQFDSHIETVQNPTWLEAYPVADRDFNLQDPDNIFTMVGIDEKVSWSEWSWEKSVRTITIDQIYRADENDQILLIAMITGNMWGRIYDSWLFDVFWTDFTNEKVCTEALAWLRNKHPSILTNFTSSQEYYYSLYMPLTQNGKHLYSIWGMSWSPVLVQKWDQTYVLWTASRWVIPWKQSYFRKSWGITLGEKKLRIPFLLTINAASTVLWAKNSQDKLMKDIQENMD